MPIKIFIFNIKKKKKKREEEKTDCFDHQNWQRHDSGTKTWDQTKLTHQGLVNILQRWVLKLYMYSMLIILVVSAKFHLRSYSSSWSILTSHFQLQFIDMWSFHKYPEESIKGKAHMHLMWVIFREKNPNL